MTGRSRGRPRWGGLILPALFLAAGGLACERPRGAGGGGAEDTPAPAAVPSSPAEAAPADSAPQPFARPIVVFLEASPEEIQEARARMPEEEFYVVADDLNFYRSSAWEYLQTRHIPVVRVSGRQPLRFVVADTVRSYDFTDEQTLDLLVVFDGRNPPRALPPIDVQRVSEVLGAHADSAR